MTCSEYTRTREPGRHTRLPVRILLALGGKLNSNRLLYRILIKTQHARKLIPEEFKPSAPVRNSLYRI
jgi:hypothetical protein